LEYVYDYIGRRVEKKVYSGSVGNWVLDEHLKMLYHEFNLIEKLDALNSNAIVQKFVWSVKTIFSVNNGTASYYYTHDANKNVSDLIDSAGAIKGHYEYSPFGKVVTQSGSYASKNPFRFSNEYADDETGLVYYNFRFYSPELGRWLKKDPIGERGGINLYGMVGNSPTIKIDKLGLYGATLKVTRSSTHGSVEAYYMPLGGLLEENVMMVFDDDRRKWYHLILRYPLSSPSASIEMIEIHACSSWYASLDTTLIFSNKYGGRLQLSADYHWTVQIEACCKSGFVLYSTSSSASPLSMDTSGTGAWNGGEAVPEGTPPPIKYAVAKAGKPSIVNAGTVTLGTVSNHAYTVPWVGKEFARMLVSVKCAP
jgi:RHS repeat-associated protein